MKNQLFTSLKVLLVSVFITSTLPLHGQKRKVVLLNSRKIDKDRYKDIKSSPYFYKDWQYGKLVNGKAQIVDSMFVNYNGYSKYFEVRQEEEFVELETAFYPLIIIYEGDEQIYFRRNMFNVLSGSYSRIVYSSDKASVLENLSVRKVKRNTNYAGLENKYEFIPKRKYYLILNEEIHQIKLKKKKILALLGHRSIIQAFVKKEKLALSSEEELIMLLDFYNTLQ